MRFALMAAVAACFATGAAQADTILQSGVLEIGEGPIINEPPTVGTTIYEFRYDPTFVISDQSTITIDTPTYYRLYDVPPFGMVSQITGGPPVTCLIGQTCGFPPVEIEGALYRGLEIIAEIVKPGVSRFTYTIGPDYSNPDCVVGELCDYALYGGYVDLITGLTITAPTAYQLVRVDPSAPVPEPANWAMMIGGFGIAGSALRARPRRSSVSYG